MKATIEQKSGPGYNERLFQRRGLRRFYHQSRFNWVRRTIHKHAIDCSRLIEIGCFDGRLLDNLDQMPEMYFGLDANVENGLDAAITRFSDTPGYNLIESRSPNDFSQFPNSFFGLGVSLETIEHINPDDVETYLSELARVVNGHLLISVPNERGLVFALKFISKALFFGGKQDYSLKEFIAASTGRMGRVKRNEHKGFDYKELYLLVDKYFDIQSCVGLPFRGLPKSANLTIAIHAKSRGS